MDINEIIISYTNWLKNEITVAKFDEYYELTTPYLDRFNDYLQIYIKQSPDGTIFITDDGYIIDNLYSSGMSFSANSKRKISLEKIIKRFSLELHGSAITATATADNFPQKKHEIIQAMLAIDDMFELNSENIKNFFTEDIENFFNGNGVYYSKNFSIIGKTESVYTYDFHFQKTKAQPERFCRTINKINESNRNLTIFNWLDTKENRNNEGNLIVLLNDENKVNKSDIFALESYDIEPILYSDIRKNLERFRA